jgi:hypothetical protein
MYICVKYKTMFNYITPKPVETGAGKGKDNVTIRVRFPGMPSRLAEAVAKESTRVYNLDFKECRNLRSLSYLQDGTNKQRVGTEHSNMTSVNVTRAGARGQAPRGRHHEAGVPMKARTWFWYPKHSIFASSRLGYCLAPSSSGGTEEASTINMKMNKLVFLRNPANSKGMADASI